MICPVCRDEYRPGFTRCATCDVDLVAELTAASPGAPAAPSGPRAAVVDADDPNIPFCGFLSLDEARQARDSLRAQGVRSAIMISEPPGADLAQPPAEEFWVRVAAKDFKATTAILGLPAVESAEIEDGFNCSDCGAVVGESDDACPKCGLRFEE